MAASFVMHNLFWIWLAFLLYSISKDHSFIFAARTWALLFTGHQCDRDYATSMREDLGIAGRIKPQRLSETAKYKMNLLLPIFTMQKLAFKYILALISIVIIGTQTTWAIALIVLLVFLLVPRFLSGYVSGHSSGHKNIFDICIDARRNAAEKFGPPSEMIACEYLKKNLRDYEWRQ